MGKKIALVIVMVVSLLLVAACSDSTIGSIGLVGNRQLGIDFTNTFRHYIVCIGGEVFEGEVVSWRDYAESDVVQFTDTNGVTYLTHYANVVLDTGGK